MHGGALTACALLACQVNRMCWYGMAALGAQVAQATDTWRAVPPDCVLPVLPC